MSLKLTVAALAVTCVLPILVTLGGHHKKVIIHVPYKIKTIHHTHTIYKHVPKHDKVIGYSGDVDSGKVLHGSASSDHQSDHYTASFGEYSSGGHPMSMMNNHHYINHQSAVTFAPSHAALKSTGGGGGGGGSAQGHFSSFGSYGHHHHQQQQHQHQGGEEEEDESSHNGVGLGGYASYFHDDEQQQQQGGNEDEISSGHQFSSSSSGEGY